MTLLDTITLDYKEAMKNKEEIKKSALNYLLSQVKNKKIELQRDVEDDEIMALIKKEIKSINEAISFLERAGNKAEEIQQEQQKKEVLNAYLPETLSYEATEALIASLLEQLQISDLKTQRGVLMKTLMEKYKSEIDTAIVNEIINKKISES